MSSIRNQTNFSLRFLGFIPLIFGWQNRLKLTYKTHNYSKFSKGTEYEFEWLNESRRACMTGFGRGITPGDYIILQQDCKPYRYQVEEIDYYSEPSDMWIALLKEV
jgi:MioC protein